MFLCSFAKLIASVHCEATSIGNIIVHATRDSIYTSINCYHLTSERSFLRHNFVIWCLRSRNSTLLHFILLHLGNKMHLISYSRSNWCKANPSLIFTVLKQSCLYY
eukprot:NODE_139_length_17940_cov_0.254190.p11 type:complete len:106 gc:universal NODE_139_length_17940_cov_0.254190:3795-4112(+)